MTANTRNIGLADESAAGLDQAAGFTRSLAVVIGIDDYIAPIPRLKTPGNDARGIQDVLARQQQFTVLPPLTEDVTHSRLLELFTVTLPGLNLGPSDRLLVYFAGHGTELAGAGGEPEYYLVPQDARPDDRDSFLPMRLVRDALLKLQCRHLLLVLDCCFAGGFGRMRSLDDLPPKIYKQRFDFYVSSPAWQVIASAAHDETALDTAGGCVFGRRATGSEGEHSPFASALFDALAGQADVNPAPQEGEKPGDGLITATELYQWVRDEVQKVTGATHRQSPGLWPLPNHEAGEFVFRNPERALLLEDALPLTAGTNPYRGLNSYDEAQSHLFFGRAKQIAALTEKVAAEPFVAVLGVSGTGKSSLAKAGLIPALGGSHRAGDPPEPRQVGETRWLTLPPFRPTAEPVASLTRMLTDHLPTYMNQVPAPASDATALAALVAAWRADHRDARLALVIDQFEELVTLCADKEQRQHFQALLANALAAPDDALRVIITLRTDFEPQFNQGVLQPFWGSAARYVVLPMSQDELRQVILGPAWASEIYFEPRALVDALINEVVQAPGGLPLLSFALSEMYLRYIASGRQDRTLRQADFDAVGGVIGSLRAAANAIWDGLDPAHRATMERLMLRMIAIGGGEVARRRVAWAELDYGEPENTRRDAVIGQLKEARLVVRDEGAGWVEPAHDALVSGWDKLTEWKFTAAPYLPLQRDLAPAALLWQADGAKPSLLWDDDPRLPQVEETLWPTDGKQKGLGGRVRWARQVLAPRTDAPAETKWLNGAELAFVQTSVRARARFWQRSIGFGLIALLIAGILLAFGFNQKQQSAASAREATTSKKAAATEQALRATSDANAMVAVANEGKARIAEATAVAAQAETERLKRGIQADQLTAKGRNVLDESPPLGLLLAAEGLRLQHDVARTQPYTATRIIFDFAQAAYVQESDVITRETVVGSAQTNVHELLGRVGGKPLLGHQDTVTAVAFSPDGRWLATASSDTTARLWDVTAADPSAAPIVLAGHGRMVTAVAFSPDGRWLATASWDHTARLWDMTDPGADPTVLEVYANRDTAVAFSPDGRWLANTSDGDVAGLRDMTTSDPNADYIGLAGHGRKVTAVVFSPDSRWLATAAFNGAAGLWDMTAADPSVNPIVLTGHGGSVTDVTFSPDGRWLATASSDNTARLWDVTAANPGADPIVLTGHENSVNAVAFSPDGRWLATASSDATARLWDVSPPEPRVDPIVLTGHGAEVTVVAFSPAPLGGGTSGRWLATASGEHDWSLPDNTARLWDITAANPGADPIVLTGHDGSVNDVSFSPDGRWLATASGEMFSDRLDGTVRLWDLTALDPSADPILLTGHKDEVRSVTFSPDGRWLATASDDNTARLWDVTAADPGADSIILTGHSDSVTFVAFSPDGRWLATASEDNTARLWDVTAADPRANSILLTGHEDFVVSMVFSPDGRWLATASWDNTARLWDVTAANPGADPIVLTGHENLVRAVAFSPNGRWLATASGDALSDRSDNTARLWDVTAADPSANPIVLTGHEDFVVSVVFSPDSRWLATASWDNTARLWDVTAADPSADPIVLTGHENLVHAVAFSPDGRRLATASSDNTARLWTWRIDDLIEAACRFSGRNLTAEEWQRNFPDKAYRQTCPQWPVHRSITQPLRDEGRELAAQGDIAGAVAKFEEALKLDPGLTTNPEASRNWNSLCWAGATWNQAALVLDACETAVKLAPKNGNARDSRGLARALTGDVQGAIADFEFTLKRADAEHQSDEFIAARTRWVEALRASKDPRMVFDAATLEKLRND